MKKTILFALPLLLAALTAFSEGPQSGPYYVPGGGTGLTNSAAFVQSQIQTGINGTVNLNFNIITNVDTINAANFIGGNISGNGLGLSNVTATVTSNSIANAGLLGNNTTGSAGGLASGIVITGSVVFAAGASPFTNGVNGNGLTNVSAATAANALTTNQVGAWLIHTNLTRTFYGMNLAGAYADENTSDILFLENGLYTGGFSLSKTVHWVGQSAGVWDDSKGKIVHGAIVTNGIGISLGCSNSILENIGLEATDMALDCGIQSSNIANNSFLNLVVACVGGGGAHTAYITGGGNLVDGVKCYGKAQHGILAIGCSNTIVRNCFSSGPGNSYVIKGDPDQCGSCGNVRLENCQGDGGVLIQAAAGATMGAVSICNLSLDNASGKVTSPGSVWIAASANSSICDLSIVNMSLRGYRATDMNNFGTLYGNGGTFTNINFVHCSLSNPYRLDCMPLATTGALTNFTQWKVTDSVINGIRCDESGFSSTARLFTGEPNSAFGKNTLSIMPNDVEAAFATNGHLYLFYPTNYLVYYSDVNPGDPIWVSNSAAAGVWAYETNGLKTAGFPLPNWHQLFNYQWNYIQLTYTGTNGEYSPPSAFLHGKVLAWATLLQTYNTALVDMTATANNGLGSVEKTQAGVRLMGDGSGLPTIKSLIGPTTTTTYNTIVPYAWATSTATYFGVFAAPWDAFTIQYWPCWGGLSLDMTVHDQTMYMYFSPTNGWQ